MHRSLPSYDRDQAVGVSFDISHEKKYLIKLCQSQKCLYSYKITDSIVSKDRTHREPLRRPINFQGHGSLRNNLRCAPKSQHFAYTDREHVYVGEFSEIGFTDHNQMVELDFMSTVLSIDWVQDQTHLIGGTDDDYASIWDVEKMDIVSRFKENSVASKTTLVSTSRRNPFLFVTCHESDIKVWDRRRPVPCQSFSGHANKIHHVDWWPQDEHYFITCSLDRTVKLWNWKQARVPVLEKRIGQQVWRAMYDPLKSRTTFIAIVVPEDKLNGVAPLVCDFMDDSDYKLNTASESPIVEARMFSDTGSTALVGMDMKGHFTTWHMESPSVSRHNLSLNLLSPNAENKESVSAFSNDMPLLSSSPNSTITLPTLPEKYGKNVQIEGSTYHFKNPNGRFRLKMDTAVPETPHFSFEDSSLNTEKKNFYLQKLDKRSQEIIIEESSRESSRTKLDRLFQYVLQEINDINQDVEDDKSVATITRGSKTKDFDRMVPFPRTNGARFCSNNILIIMRRPTNPNDPVENAGVRQKTPRAYLDVYSARVGTMTKKRDKTPSTPSVSDFYYTPAVRTRQSRGQSESSTCKVKPVEIQDISGILPNACRELSQKFSLDSGRSLAELCDHNMAIATDTRRSDLVQLWRVLRVCTNPSLVEHLYQRKLWDEYPYGRKLVESYIECFYMKKDVQSLAMIYGMCTLVERQIQECGKFEGRKKFQFFQPGRTLFSLSKSLSTSVSIEHQCSEESEVTLSPVQNLDQKESEEMSGVDGDLIKLNYATILYNWGMLNQRAEVLKTVANVPGQLVPDRLSSVFEPRSDELWECVVCRLPVKTLWSYCLLCSHGGHSNHLKAWFTSSIQGQPMRECPTGCGCLCADYMGSWN